MWLVWPVFFCRLKICTFIRYFKSSTNRWFAHAGDSVSHETSWHSCSPGSAPTMHLFHVVCLSYSEVTLVYFHAALYPQSHSLWESKTRFPAGLNRALELENSRGNEGSCHLLLLPSHYHKLTEEQQWECSVLGSLRVIIYLPLPASQPWVPPTHPSTDMSACFLSLC